MKAVKIERRQMEDASEEVVTEETADLQKDFSKISKLVDDVEGRRSYRRR